MALLILLSILQGLTPAVHCFSLCGWRTQYNQSAVLQYQGGYEEDTLSIENHMYGLIIRGPYVPSTNIQLQTVPGKYTFCVHWLPGLQVFNLTHGLQNYTVRVTEAPHTKDHTPHLRPKFICTNDTLIVNMTLNGQQRKGSCRFDLHLHDWLNDSRLLEHEMSVVSQILDTEKVHPHRRMLRHWIDATLSRVQFEGERLHFAKGSLQAAVFRLDSPDVLASVPEEMDISMSLPKELFQETATHQPQRLHVVKIRGSSLFHDQANSTVLAEHIIGVSLENRTVSDLCEDVVFIFQHPPVPANHSPVCVFWNESAESWSPDGCRTFPQENQTECRCNHLTYFAVLMQISPQVISEVHLVSLTALTFAGCTISAIAALFTICWGCCSRKVQTNPTLQIHMHLLAAVFLLDVSFVLSALVGALDDRILCKSSAIFLHTAQLCNFTWMAIEGFNLYRLVVKVFEGNFLTTRKLAIVGWGLPILVILIISLTNFENYGAHSIQVDRSSSNSTAMICWLTEPVVHLVLDVGLFGMVLILNLGMLIAMTRCVLHLTPHTRGQEVRHCVTLLALSCMLGLPWGFAFFSFGVLYLPMQYVFSILTSLQGGFIFLWYYTLSQPRGKEPLRSSSYSSATPASPRSEPSVLMSDHRKLLT
uniref:Adhesion G-protein coupled receptor G1 n=1 Tax=Leptobrachium leishanense TaxID=445787 RepID=A0A8C5QRA0_9ANUR